MRSKWDRSRELWLQQGDKNTKIFYIATKIRNSTNTIRSLVIPVWESCFLYWFIENSYPSVSWEALYWSVFPKIVVKRFLTEEAEQWLIRKVTFSKEIKSTHFQMNPDKAPEPDEFNARFFQKNLKLVKDDVVALVLSFNNGKLLKEVNHTFLTLIPKYQEASSTCDCRPISCCNVISKLISKIHSNRLKRVMGQMVSAIQDAFLEGRHISDCSQYRLLSEWKIFIKRLEIENVSM